MADSLHYARGAKFQVHLLNGALLPREKIRSLAVPFQAGFTV
jgi:hypothetical protein